MSDAENIRAEAVRRHDLDSGIFQGRYRNLVLGKYTDAFIYGRYMLGAEIEAELAALAPGSRVLDVGCGTGHFCRAVQAAGHEVVGVDPSTEMLHLARTNFPDLDFREGIATRLPFPDGSFDLVLAIEVLRYLAAADVRDSYREMHRVLKPGGRLFVTHVNRWASDGYLLYYHLVRLWHRLRGRPYHHCYFTGPELEARLATQVGFGDVRVWGRMWGWIRIGYKLGWGPATAMLGERLSPAQTWKRCPGRAQAGHLLVTALKA